MNVEKKPLEYNIKLNANEINVILQALGELPAKVSVNVLLNLQDQAHKAEVAEALKPEPEKEKEDEAPE